MSNENKRTFNISSVLGIPVINHLEIPNDQMWTGMIKPEDVDSFLVDDPEKREELIKLIERHQNLVYKTRKNLIAKSKLGIEEKAASIFGNALGIGSKSNNRTLTDELEEMEMLLTISTSDIKSFLNNFQENSVDVNAFLIKFYRRYEEVLLSESEEKKYFSQEQKKVFRTLGSKLNDSIIIGEAYIPEEERFVALPFLTMEQEKRFTKEGRNYEEFEKAIRVFAGRDDLTEQERDAALTEMAKAILIIDLEHIIPSLPIKNKQIEILMKNSLLAFGYKKDEIEQMDMLEMAEAAEDYNSLGSETHARIMAGILDQSSGFIDTEKFLLTYMTRILQSCDMAQARKEEIDESIENETQEDVHQEPEVQETQRKSGLIEKAITFDDYLKMSAQIKENVQRILDSKMVRRTTRIETSEDSYFGKQTINLKLVNSLMENFCGDFYLTEGTGYALVNEMISKFKPLSVLDDELLQKLDIDERQVFFLSLCDKSNFVKLYKCGKISEQVMQNIVATIKAPDFEDLVKDSFRDVPDKIETAIKNGKELVDEIITGEYLNNDSIRELVLDGTLEPTDFDKAYDSLPEDRKGEFTERMKNVFSINELLKYYGKHTTKYLEFVEKQEREDVSDEEKEKANSELADANDRKNRMLKMFDMYNKFASKDDKEEFMDDALSEYIVENEVTDEDLQVLVSQLYADRVIALENIVSIDNKLIMPMLDGLSFEDMDKLKRKMSFDDIKDLLDEVFLGDEYKYTDERKFIILMNLLDGEVPQERNAMDEYKQLLEFDKEKRTIKKPTGKIPPTPQPPKPKGTSKYAYPDFVKWKFYRALDPNCVVTRYTNGYVEFASPKLGVRYIEKYYDGDKPAYGTATFVMSEQDYKNNESKLVKYQGKGKIIDTDVLRTIVPRRDRIHHTTVDQTKQAIALTTGKQYVTWMDSVLRHQGIMQDNTPDTRYTAQEKQELINTVHTYKYSREEIR